MRQLIVTFILLGALCAPGSLLSQNNRISIQTDLFHYFFDRSPIIDINPNSGKRKLTNLFGGVLNDSRGVHYQRVINDRSSISAEYMIFETRYDYEEVYNDHTVKPVYSGRGTRCVNVTYSRKLNLYNKLDFIYGGGLNYLWGEERIYHYTYFSGWGEPRFYGFFRHDLGLNARTGLDYSPLKWLTFSTNLDFIGVLRLQATDVHGNNLNDFYKEKFGLTNMPSRYDLSWRFGIGFNF